MTYEIRQRQDDCCELYHVDNNSTETFLGADYGTPEDNSFHRDWAWVPAELNQLAAKIKELEKQLSLAREASQIHLRQMREAEHERNELRARLTFATDALKDLGCPRLAVAIWDADVEEILSVPLPKSKEEQ